MNQPPLNPDALEAGHEAYRRAYFKDGAPAPRCFEKGLSAYLAAALPEVTSVEELEALPEGSVFIDGDGEVCQIEIDGESHFNGDPYRRFSVVGDYKDHELDEAIFPARVLYRPEVNDA